MYFLDLLDDRIDDVQAGVGRRSATRSWSSAATACGTATSTRTTSAPRSRSRSTSTVGRAQIRVTDLFEEVAEEHAKRERGDDGRRRRARRHPPRAGAGLPPVTTAVVAVCSGDGLVELFAQLGVQGVVTGGQTHEPVDRRTARHGRARQRRTGRDPAEQQEHHPGRRAGRRAHHQDRQRRADHVRCPRRWRRSWCTTRRPTPTRTRPR